MKKPNGEKKFAAERTGKRVNRWKRAVSLAFTSTVIGLAGLIVILLYLRSSALPVIKISQTTQIYDIHGTLIDSFSGGQNRQIVPLSEISPDLIHATLAIEDHRFYEHFGLDPQGIARAIVVDLRTMSMDQGASTITQQLARNLYLNHDRTWGRKLKEMVYAVQLELQLSKDQILESYLNQIYYGFSTYGVEAAAEMYFGKHAKDLTLAESAMLAGIPKGPKYYSPYLNMDNARKRQRDILDAMVRYNYITEAQEEAALQEKLTILPRKQDQAPQAPYFVDYIKNIAVDRLGIKEDEFDGGGIKVYTTLDLQAQKDAEEAVGKELKDYPDMQAALVSIDPRNGYIKAMVGGRNYEENQYNRVFANTRQPGSSFKPILYLTALQHDFTAVTRIKSEPTTFTYDNGRKTYTPSNYANQYVHDYIDLRKAIARSDNIYAVTTIMRVGAQNVIDMARKLGIDSPMDPVPSLALGTFPVSPFEMAEAYSIFANQGVRIEPTAILRIEDARGKVLYQAEPKQEKIIDPAYTYVLTNLMESVFEEGGTGSRVASILKRPVAGKTGTTDADAWMVGYTPELATAVWVGYDRDRNLKPVEEHLAAPIFAEYMESALKSVPPKLFPVPDGVVSVYIDPATGKLANGDCPNARLEAFVKGTEPTEYCTEHGAGNAKDGKTPDVQDKNRSWWQDLKRWWND
jgi:1A family penicillin-binding protein